MKLIRDLLAMKQEPAQLDEARESIEGLIERYIDQEKMYHFEGGRGVQYLGKLVRALDNNYRDLDTFLEDNPGAQQAIVEWIGGQRSPEWTESLKSQLHDGKGEEE